MTEQEMEQLMQRISAGREYRLMQSFSVRSNSNDDSGMIADGYATTFNQHICCMILVITRSMNRSTAEHLMIAICLT